MNSHELAKKLLLLPNKPVIATRPAPSGFTATANMDKDRGYVVDYNSLSDPWEDATGSIRIQVSQNNKTEQG